MYSGWIIHCGEHIWLKVQEQTLVPTTNFNSWLTVQEQTLAPTTNFHSWLKVQEPTLIPTTNFNTITSGSLCVKVRIRLNYFTMSREIYVKCIRFYTSGGLDTSSFKLWQWLATTKLLRQTNQPYHDTIIPSYIVFIGYNNLFQPLQH